MGHTSCLTAIVTLIHVVLSTDDYPFATWMHQLSSHISSKTIFEIVLPGAHKAGMIWSTSDIDSTSNTFSPYANDHFSSVLQTLDNYAYQRAWAERQRLSIYNMLMSGIRVLDLQFEHDAISTYYAHNGIYGQTVDEILDGVLSFLNESNTENEIIIMYLSDFSIRSASDSSSSALEGLFTIILQHAINKYIIKPNTYDITTQTVSELTSNQQNIILFTDEFPSSTDRFNEWFYDSNEYLNTALNIDLYNKDNITETLSETQAIIINNLRSGWDPNKLNLIYWIPILSNTFTEKYFYASYFAFNAPFSQQLHPFIEQHSNLWFANVLFSDFIASSDVVQQSIVLNIKYSQCNDDYSYYPQCLTSFACDSTHSASFSDNSCNRTCGLCTDEYESRNPGDSCHSDVNCNGEIYSIFTDASTGTCTTPHAFNSSSFCLSVFPQTSCIDYWSIEWDPCIHTNLSQCTYNCSADYDCVDAFCNSQYSICMSWNTSADWRSFSSALVRAVQRYWPIRSQGAASVLAQLEPFRPGDSSAAYTETTGDTSCSVDTDSEIVACVFDSMSVSPYMKSVIGLILIPLVLSMLLCVCYCCLWPWWCCCESYTKQCCCDKCCTLCYDENTARCCCDNDPLKCVGTPQNSPWIHWIPCVILGIAVVVSLWATIDGLVANTNIHEVIFDEPDSFQVATDDFFEEVVVRLTEVRPSLEFIVSSTLLMLETTFSIIVTTKDVESEINDFNLALHKLTTDYVDSLDLTATVLNPLAENGTDTFTIQCSQCHDVSDQALDIGDEFDAVIIRTLQTMVNTIKRFQPLYDLRQSIKQQAEILFTDLDGVIEKLQEVQISVSGTFATASELDSKYRETWLTILLCFALVLIILPIIGVLFRSKYCFKVNWCCSMWLGTLFMFITSFSALIIVLWGDFCVRLDEFEVNGADSQIGKQLELDEAQFQFVNACLSGQSIIELYELGVFDWDSLRVSVRTQLTSRTEEQMYLDQFTQFKADVEAININAFTEYVESFITKANEVGDYCGCGAAAVQFSTENLLEPLDQCTSQYASYWEDTAKIDDGVCQSAFVNASFAAQANASLFSEAESTMNGFKQDAFNLFREYDTVVFPLSLELYNEIQNLSCTTDPLFEAIDDVVFNFSNCGFVGEYYGNIKENGCVLLFNETYYIARALTIIAFMCIIIVFFSYCMDYVYGPPAIYRKKKQDYDEVSGDNDGNIELEETIKANRVESDVLLNSAGNKTQTMHQESVYIIKV